MPITLLEREEQALKHTVYQGQVRYNALGLFICNLPERIGYHLGAVYTGHTIKKKGDRWLLIVRATVNGNKKVAFFESDSILLVWRNFYSYAMIKDLKWKDDKY